jgi:hypothetical protein
LWTIGWICAILFAASISRDFSVWKNDGGAELAMTQPANGKMIVTVTQPELEQSENLWWIDDESHGWDITSDTLKLSTVKIDDIKPSPDNNYHVFIKKYSYGRNEEEAMDRARNIQYNVLSKDSILDLASGYAISRDKKIKFDESVKEKLSQVNFKIKRKHRKGVVDITIDDDNDWRFGFETGVDYIMGDKKLLNPNGKTVSEAPSENRNLKNDTNNFEKPIKKDTLEERKKWLEEELKKVNEKQKQGMPGTFIKENNVTKEKNEFSRGPSPGFSLFQIY